MGIFSNSNPLSGKKTTPFYAYLAYGLLSFISIYLTAESIIQHWGVPWFFAYALGIAVVLLIAISLSLIKSGSNNRNITTILGGVCLLALVWFASLRTNSHNLFLMQSYNEIIECDKSNAISDIKMLMNNPRSLGRSVIIDYERKGRQHLTEFISELTDSGEPGYHDKAKARHLEFDTHINFSTTKNVSDILKKYPNNLKGYIKASNEKIEPLLSNALRSVVSSMDTKLDKIKDCPGFINLGSNLSELENDTEFKSAKLINYSQENKDICHCAKDILVKQLNVNPSKIECDLKSTELASSDLQKIDRLHKWVFTKHEFCSSNGSNKFRSGYIWSLFIAFIIDVGAIAVFYKWIIK